MANDLLAATQALTVSMEALAAIGAVLRQRLEGLEADPRVGLALASVTDTAVPGLIDAAPRAEQEAVLGFIRSFLRQAVELVENPGRAPGWTFEDPVILQQIGRASRQVARAIEKHAASEARLAAILSAAPQVLDVGTGVGWLAVDMAQSWPGSRVTGIDIFEPALRMARDNVAASGLDERVEIRAQSVTDLPDGERYDLAWFAGPFMPRAVVETVMPRLRAALKPGGCLVFGLFGAPPVPLAQHLAALRVARSGGHPWSMEEASTLLETGGFEAVTRFAAMPPIAFVCGFRS